MFAMFPELQLKASNVATELTVIYAFGKCSLLVAVISYTYKDIHSVVKNPCRQS